MTKQWPVGLVSHLVLWYSVIVTIVLFFITPIKNNNSWQNNFSKIFPKIILPLIIMMFVSISIRINAYGITEKRYFTLILGIWLFFIMKSLQNGANTLISPLSASYNYETFIIKVIYKGNQIYTKNLNFFVKNLIDKYGMLSKENALSPEEMTLTEENEKVKVKFIFLNISGNKSDTNRGINPKEINFYMLVKIK
nr:DUF4153 domain-containing protein [Clostridium sp. AWRP]